MSLLATLPDLAHLPAAIWAAVRHTEPLELVAVLTGIACVWLMARSNIWNFPVAIISCALFIVIFVRQKLYSDAGLQVAFIALAAYGWWNWLRRQPASPANGPHPEATEAVVLPVTRTPAQQWVVLLLLALAYTLGAGYLLGCYTDAALPYYDSATTAVSLVAQYQLSRRQLDNWLLWLGVDIVYVGMYWNRELPLVSLLYAFYLALAAYGFWQWLREYRQQALPSRHYA